MSDIIPSLGIEILGSIAKALRLPDGSFDLKIHIPGEGFAVVTVSFYPTQEDLEALHEVIREYHLEVVPQGVAK